MTAPASPPQAPPSPIYVVPDIHGQAEALEAALARIKAEGGPNAQIVFLGDYVDRGPDSRAVIERLSAGLNAGRNWVCLRGNHDQMFLEYLMQGRTQHPQILSGKAWTHERLGGLTTLASYGLTADDDWHKAQAQVPEAHRAFLHDLPLMHRSADLLFCHAGLRPGLPLGFQQPDDLLWIREPFLSDRRDHGWLVVHGHTALDHPAAYGNRVNLDGGAGWGRVLHVAVFEGRKGWLLGPEGRRAIPAG